MTANPHETMKLTEIQQMPPIAKWIGGVILVPLVAAFLYFAATTGEWIEFGLAALLSLLVLGGLVMWMRMELMVDEGGIHLRIGPVVRLRRSYRWDDIVDLSPKTGSAFFGGWGIRYVGDGWGYIFGGKQVLQMRLRSGRTCYFTTDHSLEILQYFHRRQSKR